MKKPYDIKKDYITIILGIAFFIITFLAMAKQYREDPTLGSIVIGASLVFVGLLIGIAYLIHRFRGSKKK